MIKQIIMIALIMGALSVSAQQRSNPQLDSLRNEKNPVTLQSRLTKLGTGNEADMSLLVQYYGRDRSKVDSLNKIILQRFPKGAAAAAGAQSKIYNEPVEKQEIMLTQFRKDFPAADDDMILYSIAFAYANIRNMPKAAVWAEQIKRQEYKYGIVESIMAKDLATAESVVRKDVEKFSKGDKNAEYFKVITAYSNILTKLGKDEQAFPYLKQAYDNGPGRNDVLIRNYAYVQSIKGNYTEALPIMEKLVLEGKADKQLKDQMLTAYAKVNPGKDASVYLVNLQSSMKAKMEEQVAKMMVLEDSPNFVVKDVNGNTVSLADFKGKTIVLDFWATWCGPCKKSFPAMQLAVNKYKNDPNVKFLFIHTWERVADPLTDAKQYLKDTKYSFDLYMDTKDAVTKTSPAVSLFKVRGIPAKFVIDGAGKVRFKMTGFGGGDEAAVEELSTMIEMSRKSKS